MGENNAVEQGLSDSVQAILAAAEELFALRGYKAASLNEVAKLAGMSKANIFHHFGSKQELYLAVLRYACERSTKVLKTAHSEAGENMAEVFRELHRNYLTSMFENFRSTHLMLRVVNEDFPEAKEMAAKVFSEHFFQFVDLIKLGQRDGVFRSEVDPALLALMSLALNSFYFQTHNLLPLLFQDASFLPPQGFCDAAIDVVFRGILVQKKNQ